MEPTPSKTSIKPSRYFVEEVAGTLFLRYGNLVVAASIGEQDAICDSVRMHFEYLAASANSRLDSGGPLPDDTGEPTPVA